jgi:hypothetical protein
MSRIGNFAKTTCEAALTGWVISQAARGAASTAWAATFGFCGAVSTA